MVEEYRKAVRGLYLAFHGEDGLRNPTAEEWADFSRSCSIRDMGTHLCALPTGEHCPKGLVCLGCVHAQPKKSAAPIFRRMLASHERELGAARGRGEPAGQIASRELEVVRIRGAMLRVEELAGDCGRCYRHLRGVATFHRRRRIRPPLAGMKAAGPHQQHVNRNRAGGLRLRC